jgi:hypothetical protein
MFATHVKQDSNIPYLKYVFLALSIIATAVQVQIFVKNVQNLPKVLLQQVQIVLLAIKIKQTWLVV